MSESCLLRYLKKIGLSVLITMVFVMNGLIGSVITAYAENTVVSESNEDITDDGGVNYYIFWDFKRSIYLDEYDARNDSGKNLEYVGTLISNFAERSGDLTRNIEVYYITSSEAEKKTGDFTTIKNNTGVVNLSDVISQSRNTNDFVDSENRDPDEFNNELYAVLENKENTDNTNVYILLTDGQEKLQKESKELLNESNSLVYWVDISRYKATPDTTRKRYDSMKGIDNFFKEDCIDAAPLDEAADDVLLNIETDVAGRLNIDYSINNEELITENSTTSDNWMGYATTEVVEVTSVELYGVATPTDGGVGSNNDGFINKLKSWWTNGIVGKLIIIFSALVVVVVITLVIILTVNRRQKKKRKIECHRKNVQITNNNDVGMDNGHNYNNSIDVQIEVIGRKPDVKNVHINGSAFIGRANTCDVFINEVTVSRQHIVLECKNGELFVQPLMTATNSTKLNGKQITDRHQLFSGDRLMIGAVGIIVRW